MKTINEAAEEYSIRKENEHESYMRFEAGVGFAQRWISVEDELPEHHDAITETGHYYYTVNPVLVKTKNGRHDISARSKFKGNENSKWSWKGSSIFDKSVTHWRPIEFK